MSFAVLFVCTGNICRSPMAERLLLARLDGMSCTGFQVGSAGTRAVEGHAMDSTCARVLGELGGRPDGHVARQLSIELLRASDLVLAAGAVHRSAILQLDPAAMRRTFTMREFVRLGARLPAPSGGLGRDALAERVAAAASWRGQLDPPGPGADEIGDPYGAPLADVRRCGAQVSEAVDGIMRLLGVHRHWEA